MKSSQGTGNDGNALRERGFGSEKFDCSRSSRVNGTTSMIHEHPRIVNIINSTDKHRKHRRPAVFGKPVELFSKRRDDVKSKLGFVYIFLHRIFLIPCWQNVDC